ncbi:MAG: sensor histidine kinase [Deltaproteobacteria bacterium]|nr:sensor histidine kinase [Deltaproteobacteria bacterium]
MRSKISFKLTLILLFSSLVPLLVFGGLSLWQLQTATRISVIEGNYRVSQRAAQEIEQYITHALNILESTASNLNHVDLENWQKERILKNYVSRFSDFNEITLWDPHQKVEVTSRVGEATWNEEVEAAYQASMNGKTYLSQVIIKPDLTPILIASYPIYRMSEVIGVLIAQVDLMRMWDLIDHIRIGQSGVLHVLDVQGRFIGTGDGKRKREVFNQNYFQPQNQIEYILKKSGAIFKNSKDIEVISVGVKLGAPLFWSVIVEEPTREAFSLAYQIGWLLFFFLAGILVFALGAGYFGGKSEILKPIQALLKGTTELSKGNLNYQVTIQKKDEFKQLGDSFNQMIISLKELQEKLLREEKHALFGRVASGLAHDLKHPIQAIENSSRLMERYYEDPEYRASFKKTVEREFNKINGFLLNLHNLTHDIPFRPITMDACVQMKDAVETFEAVLEKSKMKLTENYSETPLLIRCDPQSFNRCLSNLISNAIQAMKAGGVLSLSVFQESQEVILQVQDSGMGIAPERLKTLFDDFVTTKSNGLGLGLAITRKIIEQHSGKISVRSQLGEGTCFEIRLPKV